MKKSKYYKIFDIKLNIMSIFLFIFFIIISFYLIKIMYFNNNKYIKLLEENTNKEYILSFGQRGDIYDRNGNLLVGSKEVYNLAYIKNKDTNIDSEIKLIKDIYNNIEIEYKYNDNILKKYYYATHITELLNKLDNKIKSEYKNGNITKQDYLNSIYELITNDNLSSLTEKEKCYSYIYYLMNKGYTYERKIIKENLTEKEIEYINNKYIDELYIDTSYVRYYPYGSLFRSYLGSVGNIPKEEQEEYLSQGYRMDELVGISYLEKEYEKYLKGTNTTYTIDASGKKKIVSEGKKGNDLVLSIDINLQNDIENIIYEELVKAKKENNTEYYNKAYSIISDPNTGSLLAAAAVGIIPNNTEYLKTDYLLDLSSVSITPGSIVKGASHIVGYETGAIEFNTTVEDGCIYIKNTPKKCSWKSLGTINDLLALKYSSNYYQFLIAIKVANGKYKENYPLYLDTNAFSIYRNTYNKFGLGLKTGLDIPNENIGYIGKDDNPGSILDFPIGQYDTYTPMQLINYINTLASGKNRLSLHFLFAIYENYNNKENIIYKKENEILNTLDINEEYIKRVQEGLSMVMSSGGTGSGYVNTKYNPVGKTGTAQSFIDTNNDNEIDTETITTSFGFYAPRENPKVSMVVISPNVSSLKTNYTSSVNKRISRKISDLYFTKYYTN